MKIVKLLNLLDIVQLSKRLRVYSVLSKVEGSSELKEALKRPEDRKKVAADSLRHAEVKKLTARAKVHKALELQLHPRSRSSPSKKGGRGGGRNRRGRDRERHKNKNNNNNNRNNTNNTNTYNSNQQRSTEQQSDASKPYQQPKRHYIGHYEKAEYINSILK